MCSHRETVTQVQEQLCKAKPETEVLFRVIDKMKAQKSWIQVVDVLECHTQICFPLAANLVKFFSNDESTLEIINLAPRSRYRKGWKQDSR